MATTTPSSRLDHLKICMDCSGEGTRHVTDSGKGSLPIRRTVTCARCDGEGLIYVGPEEGREEALRRKAAVDAHKRAGELTADEVEKLVAIIQTPKQFKIPTWFLNRQKDYKTGKYSQAFANTLHTTLRSDLERLKKIRAHRGLRHYWCIRVRGQHTKSTGRRGKTMAATKK